MDETHFEDKTLLSWSSPSRPFKKRSREFYATLVAIVLLVSAILFFFSQYALILAVWALTFLAIVLSTVSPHNVEHKITTQGIVIDQRAYLWNELYDFYFKKHFGEEVLEVRSRTFLPTLIVLTLGNISKEEVKKATIKYLPYREKVERTFMDKAADWLTHTFPLEKS